MKLIYLVLRRSGRHNHYMESWTDAPLEKDYILLSKECYTLDEHRNNEKLISQ